ncbi:aryl-sulfate sulfotransferase [Bifidobacterium felsineum]|uniref:aryl-sulfate sulfotransferase n=1 Tax=Bifidobacterium felsineum TaxID=2045440 RepID=UPI001BDCF62D|nr:aryl-sulfate sulfotransferase [Bifidobacterium felsineum]MBT1163860.1 aryl-sulfate sulfotransferase [Bifidobacterium felsineum]
MSSTVRARIFRIAAAIITIAIALGLCLFYQDDVSAAIKQRRVERLNAQVENIYTTDYQSMMDEQLTKERDGKERTVDSIYTKVNPYGTNTTSMYVYFTTDTASTVSYTVSADGYPDYTATAVTSDEAASAIRSAINASESSTGNTLSPSASDEDSVASTVAEDSLASTTHEFLVLGLIPQVKNTVTLTITATDGTTTTRTITQNGPKLLGSEEVKLEETTSPDSTTLGELGNGLYAILGNDSDEQDFMYYYDANGVLRGEVPVLYYRSHRLLFDNNGLMWLSASTKNFVAMNRLGKIVKNIDLGDRFILHHDYALDSDGNIVSLATDLKRSDHAVQDQVIKVNTSTGKVSLLVDFGELFADYKASTDHSGIDESDPTAKNRWDWIHFNTIQLMDDGSALLSARETSTMIKINDIEGTPKLDYMIGEPTVWDGMSEQDSFLTKVGDFGDTGGQHSITVQYDSSLPSGQYYVYLFDNNFGYAMTRPDYDWTVIDGISTAQSSKDENSNSQFRKYLVDENAGTYTEVQSFDVPYSPYVSSAQELSDDLNLVDTGMQGVFGVYDDSGNLKAQYKMELSTAYIYRVYQYGFRGFYFA